MRGLLFAPCCLIALGVIGQQHTARTARFQSRLNLAHRQGRLGLKARPFGHPGVAAACDIVALLPRIHLPAGCRRPWQSTTLPPPDSCPACRSGRSTGVPHPPSACTSSRNRGRRQSTTSAHLRSDRADRSTGSGGGSLKLARTGARHGRQGRRANTGGVSASCSGSTLVDRHLTVQVFATLTHIRACAPPHPITIPGSQRQSRTLLRHICASAVPVFFYCACGSRSIRVWTSV